MMLKFDFTNSAKIDIDLDRHLHFVKANNIFQLALSNIFRDLKKNSLFIFYILHPFLLFLERFDYSIRRLRKICRSEV